MGTLVGHVAPGFGFLLIGLWHLFNHIKLHAVYPNSYTSSPWFPTSILRHLELFLIMGGSTLSIAMELFIGPDRHQPFDTDGTIPSNHLHNFEHSLISMSFFIYAAFAILLDRTQPKALIGLTYILGAVAFGQQLLLFHLHAADHMAVEDQYQLLLQVVIVTSLTTTLMGIALPKSFIVSFVGSLSIFFQGVWFIVMGLMLWSPKLIPKGCCMNLEEGHFVVLCKGDHSLHRAKCLANLQFSWFLAGVSIFATFFYLSLAKIYGEKLEYCSIRKDEENEEDEIQDMESQNKNKLYELKSSIHVGQSLLSNVER